MSFTNTPQMNVAVLSLRDGGIPAVAGKLGYSYNTVKDVVKGIQRRRNTKWNLEKDIACLTYLTFNFPWSDAAENACGQIRRAAIESRWTEYYDSWRPFMQDARGLEKLRDSEEEHRNQLICSYMWHTGLLLGSPYHQRQASDIDTYAFLVESLEVLLKPIAEPGAKSLAFKARGNLLGLKWNCTPRKERSGKATMDFILSSGYFEGLDKHLRLCKWDRDAVRNALAYASRLRLEDKFQDLGEKLKIACDGKEPDYTDTTMFDDDFDVFREWFNTQARRAAKCGEA